MVESAHEPYGRYPAIPEIVDLNYNRARFKVIENALQTQKLDEARQLIADGRGDLERARNFLRDQPDMARAVEESGQPLASESDINEQEQRFDEQEQRFDELQKRLQK